MKKLILILIFVLIISLLIVIAPTFTNVPSDGLTLNESHEYVFYFNATDSGNNATIRYSSNNPRFNFTNVSFTDEFSQARQRGIINITPSSSDVGNYTIVFIVMNSSDGVDTVVRRWNVTANRAPNWTVIPLTTISEDSGNNNGTNLSRFAFDPQQANTSLTYSVIVNMTGIKCSIVFSHNLSYTPDANYTGNTNCTVRVSDEGSKTNDTNVSFAITAVDDPPNFNETLLNQSLFQGFPFQLPVNGTDIDTQYGDNLTYADNTTLFNINSSNGLINFTPTASNVGSERVNISINDSAGTTRWQIINFSVRSNTAPNFSTIYAISTNEDSEFTFNFSRNVSDIDGDSIFFFDNITLFVINRTTGMINFTPNQTHVALHQINISVNDSYNAGNSTIWNLTVVNVNDIPVRDSNIPNQSWSQDTTLTGINLTSYFSDQDSDTLTFTVNGTISTNKSITITINSTTTILTLTPGTGFVGAEYVTFIASDGNGGSNQSNNVTLNVTSTASTSTSTTSGGAGGGGSKIKESSLSLDVERLSGVIPGERIVRDIKIKNTGLVDLKSILLTVEAPQGVRASLTQPSIPLLKPNEEVSIKLVIVTSETSQEQVIIKIIASSLSPRTTTTSQLVIDLLVDKERNKLKFIQELLSTNPECAELTELTLQAENYINNNQRQEANLLLQDIEDKCRDLISLKKETPFQPLIKSNRNVYLIAVIIILISLSVGYLIREFKNKRKKEQKQKKPKFEIAS
mgnify:CR=1 FL=1